MYVCLMLDNTEVDPSEACLTIPAPNLFAEPSSPNARYVRSVALNIMIGLKMRKDIPCLELAGVLCARQT